MPNYEKMLEITWEEDSNNGNIYIYGDIILKNISSLEAKLRTSNIKKAKEDINNSEKKSYPNIIFDFSRINKIDQAGWVFISLLKGKYQVNVELLHLGKAIKQNDISKKYIITHRSKEKTNFLAKGFSHVGLLVSNLVLNFYEFFSFLGNVVLFFTKTRDLKINLVMEQIKLSALDAFWVINFLSFMIGAVMAYMGATILLQFNASTLVIDFIAIGILREFGVLSVAILMAGRTASSYTANIGSMKLNEEIDAMKVIGLSVTNILIVPRLIAMIISTPILTIFSVFFGMLGGLLVSISVMDISLNLFINVLVTNIALTHFWVGFVKAPFFAIAIALIGCYQGLLVKSSAENLGVRTTISVVHSIFVVILIDLLFDIMFLKLEV